MLNAGASIAADCLLAAPQHPALSVACARTFRVYVHRKVETFVQIYAHSLNAKVIRDLYIYVYMYIYIYMHIDVHIYIYVFIYMYIYIYIHVCIYIYMDRVHIRGYFCVINIYIYIYIYMFVYLLFMYINA